jgi:hypothetical protein
MGTHANLFDFTESIGGGANTITLTHDLGVRGSVFLANYVESMVKPLGKEFKVVKYPDAVSIKF